MIALLIATCLSPTVDLLPYAKTHSFTLPKDHAPQTSCASSAAAHAAAKHAPASPSLPQHRTAPSIQHTEPAAVLTCVCADACTGASGQQVRRRHRWRVA